MTADALSLRQRNLLRILQEHPGVLPGARIADQLAITTRTLRTDVDTVNRLLAHRGVHIRSLRGQGYTLEAEDPLVLPQLLRSTPGLQSREDRLRWLALRLCRAEEPLRPADLEEEMFVSHGTLEADLKALQRRWNLSLSRSPTGISLPGEELQRRQLLVNLYAQDWDDSRQASSLYAMEEETEHCLKQVAGLTASILSSLGIRLEDANLTVLNLFCTVSLERIRSGHLLSGPAPTPPRDPLAARAARELAGQLQLCSGCALPPPERDMLYRILASGRVLDASAPREWFTPQVLALGDALLGRIRETFGADLGEDGDFRITLLHFFRYLSMPVHSLRPLDGCEQRKTDLWDSLELAWLVQEPARTFLGRELEEKELLHLANCISGATEALFARSPELRLRTVISSQMNLSVAWALKRRVLARFGACLDLQALLPAHVEELSPWGEPDLVLSTVPRQDLDQERVAVISPWLTPEDIRTVEEKIRSIRTARLFPCPPGRATSLVEQAWHRELGPVSSREEGIRRAAQDLVARGAAGPQLQEDLLHREQICPAPLCQGVLWLPCSLPARETRLAFYGCTGPGKLRMLVLACFAPGEAGVLFHLKPLLEARLPSGSECSSPLPRDRRGGGGPPSL